LNKHLITPLLLTLFLQACGSSSSDGPAAPLLPVERTFTLTSQLTNDCGVTSAFTDVELLLQDDTWQTISTHTADEAGVISLVTTSEFINYTLVAKDQKGIEPEGLNVVSFYQASSDTKSSYQAQFDESLDNSTCECVTQDLELTHTNFTNKTKMSSSLSFDNVKDVDDSHTLFEGVKVCRVIGNSWPLHSFSIEGIDSDEDAIGAAQFIDDFSETPEGLWSSSAIIPAKNLSLALPHQKFTTNQLINGTKHFSSLVAEENDNLLVFSNHNYISENFYQSKASLTFDDKGDGFLGGSFVKTHHQIISTKASDSFLVKADEQEPAIDYVAFSEIKDDATYDYSDIPGFPVSVIAFTFTAYDPEKKILTPVTWTSYGPESGTLAISKDLTGYESIFDVNDTYTDKKSTNVRLIKSLTTSNYQDYIKYYQIGNTVENDIDASNDFISNLHQVEISISLN